MTTAKTAVSRASGGSTSRVLRRVVVRRIMGLPVAAG